MFHVKRYFLTPELCFSLLAMHQNEYMYVFIYSCIDLEISDRQWMILKATSVKRKPHVCGSSKNEIHTESLVFKNYTCSLLTSVCMHVSMCKMMKEEEKYKVEM